MKRIGFIGLGTMGAPMARNIHRAGYTLSVWNRTAGRAAGLHDLGVTVCPTPAALAPGCDAVIIMVFGPEALREVLQGPRGLCAGLEPGCVVVNMSTVSREATLAAARAVEEAGALFVDAPVAGSKKPAEDGALTILAGGEPGLVERVTPLLKTMGTVVIRCGSVGQGTAMKLFINLFLGTLMQSLAEGLCAGTKMGLRIADMLDTIKNSAVTCPLFAVKVASVSRGDFSKNFSVDLLHKDLGLLLDAAESLGVPLPVTAAAYGAFGRAREMGLGDEDMAAVVKVLEAQAGVTVRGDD